MIQTLALMTSIYKENDARQSEGIIYYTPRPSDIDLRETPIPDEEHHIFMLIDGQSFDLDLQRTLGARYRLLEGPMLTRVVVTQKAGLMRLVR